MAEISLTQFILIVVNVMLSLAGFIITFMIQRLYKSIDQLYTQQVGIQREVTLHREDLLKNYASTADLSSVRDEVFKRFDRFEDTIMKAIRRIPGP